jgi:hypothetical protein
MFSFHSKRVAMTKNFTLASLLLVSSALTAPAAFAQTGENPAGEEPVDAVEETVGPSTDDASDYTEDDQDNVDISTAGGSNTPIVVTGQ